MKFEKLDISNNKKGKWFLYGFLMCATLLIMFNLFMSYAKYKVVNSVKLAEGIVNYESADFNIIAMYKNDGEKDEPINEIPIGNYELNKEKSYCKEPENNDEIKNILDYENKKLTVEINKKGTKCYLYFDKFSPEQTLTNLGINISTIKDAPSSFKGDACAKGTRNDSNHTTGDCAFNENGIFKGTDNYGTTYYYRGTINNNWVSFAGKSWRIIRINGNGTIRLIYSGEGEPSEVADTNDIPISSGLIGNGYWSKDSTVNHIGYTYFNNGRQDNKYAGFMYGDSSDSYDGAHTDTNSSVIKMYLESWYNGTETFENTTNGTSVKENSRYLDGSTGFCNDREPYATYSDTARPNLNYGYGSKTTYYGSYIRVGYEIPSFVCNQSNDLFTTATNQGKGNGKLKIPIGLITADEVVFAGAERDYANYGYWLWSGSNYWTMSPQNVSGTFSPSMYIIFNDGALHGNYRYTLYDSNGVRPVINLKGNTKFSFSNNDTKGTIDNPYVVE